MLPIPNTDAFRTRLSASGFVILSYSILFVKTFFFAYISVLVYEIVIKTKWYQSSNYDINIQVGL